MKKKIAIWCCLGVVLAIFVYFFIEWSLRLKEFVDFYQDHLDTVLSTYRDVNLTYIKRILYIALSIIGVITVIIIAYLVFTIKDSTTEEIKEKQELRAIKKKEKILAEIENLNKKLKGD